MATDGIDFDANLPMRVTPLRHALFSGTSDAKAYMHKLIAAGKKNDYIRVATKEQRRCGILHAMFMLPKSDPSEFRDVLNFAVPLQTRHGLELPSYNDSTPLDSRTSIRPGSP